MRSSVCTKSSSDGSRRRRCCHQLRQPRCCFGRCSLPARSTCERLTVGGRLPKHPSVSQLTSRPDSVLSKCRRSRHPIPTQIATAPIATILAYASIFQFEQGYASEFGVPEQLLQFELLQILSPVGYTAFVCASLIVMAPAIMMVISPSYLLRRRGIDWVNRLAMLFLLWIVVLQLAAVFGWMLIDTTSWIALAANEIGPKIGTIGFGALLAMIIRTRFWPRIEGFVLGSTPPLSRFLGAFFIRVAILTLL